MTSDLDEATRVEGGHGHYTATLSDQWEIWGPNGGYLAAICLRAAGEVAKIGRPCSFYCHFLSSPAFGPVELEVTALKHGRRAESLSVSMTQEGRAVLHALVKTAAQAPGYELQHPRMPAVPMPQEIEPFEWAPRNGRPPFRFWENIERRPVRAAEQDARAPVIREWTRFRPTACFEDPYLDAARALILLDTFGFPAAHQRYRSWEHLAPNLDTSVWLHRFSPACEWLLIEQECTIAAHGLTGVSGRVWDMDGGCWRVVGRSSAAFLGRIEESPPSPATATLGE